jgi:two-component system, NtrC family, response regulator HydG
MRPAKVMIVDDDRDLAESLAEMLELQGHTVQVASNGQEAVDRHRKGEFDITFMDVRMPVMNGVDSFFAIRALRPNAKVVLMTGYEESMVAKALAAGALGLLTKPFQMDDLLTKLADATRPVVLVADDDADFVESLAELLQARGFQSAVASTGAEAVARVKSGSVGVLILDLRMPIMNGLQVYEELRKQGNPPPTIIVTGHAADAQDSLMALRAMSVSDCVEKPVDPTILIEKISRLLAAAA